MFNPFHFLIEIFIAIKVFYNIGRLDALLVQNGGYPGSSGNLASIFAAYFLKIKARILIVHHEASGRKPYKLRQEMFIDFFIVKLCTEIVAVSFATRKSLIIKRDFDTEITPIKVIYNGISATNTKPLKQNLNFRKKFNIKKDTFIIGTLGRLERYKGQEDILFALALLPKKIKEKFRIICVGQTENQEYKRLTSIIEKLDLNNAIIFLPYIKAPSEMIIKEFDLLAMCTKDFEAFGLTIGEAMKVKVPVLATKVGAVKEWVKPASAILVNPESPHEIKDVLMQINSKKIDLEEIASNGYNLIKNYSGNKMSQNFYDLLKIY
jgi:glycosyltransferase involved in cell wall biosynthesis